jgi:hypothetical protein
MTLKLVETMARCRIRIAGCHEPSGRDQRSRHGGEPGNDDGERRDLEQERLTGHVAESIATPTADAARRTSAGRRDASSRR